MCAHARTPTLNSTQKKVGHYLCCVARGDSVNVPLNGIHHLPHDADTSLLVARRDLDVDCRHFAAEEPLGKACAPCQSILILYQYVTISKGTLPTLSSAGALHTSAEGPCVCI